MKRILQMMIAVFALSIASVAYAADETTIEGFDPNGSNGLMTPYQQLSNQETVNLTNGNMARQWTEAVVPGRAGMDLHLTRTLAVGKTEIVIEEFDRVFGGATTGTPGVSIANIRYHDYTVEIPSLGKIHAVGTDNYHNKVTYDPQVNGWDVSWAMLRGVLVMNPTGPNRTKNPYVFLVHAGGELEQIKNLGSTDPNSNNLLMNDVLGRPANVSVMGSDGREYLFERHKQDELYYDADYIWVCGWGFLKDICYEMHTNPGWRIDAYILKEVKDAYGNRVVATTPAASQPGEILRLDMQLVPTSSDYSNTLWKTVERRIFQNHEEWVAVPGDKQRVWIHDRDEKGRFTNSKTPGNQVTKIEYDPDIAKGVYPQVRRLGLDYLKAPDSFVQIKYPTGGLVRYEHFITNDEPESSLEYAIVTEVPDVNNTESFYQKYYRISKTYTDKPDEPFITTDINTTDGAQIHQVYAKLKSTAPALDELSWPVLAQQTWTANGREVMAKYTYGLVPSAINGQTYGLQKMEIIRDNDSYVHFEASYDQIGRLASSTDEIKRTVTYKYLLSDQEFKQQYEAAKIDKKGGLIRKKDLLSFEERTIGGQPMRILYEYGGTDSCGGKIDDATLRKVTRQIGTGEAILQNEKCFDEYGNVIREVNGPTQSFGVDIGYDQFAVVKTKETDSEGHVTIYKINEDTGWLESKTGDAAAFESYKYDNDGRITKSVIENVTTENSYLAGNLVKSVSTDSISKKSAVIERQYDGLGSLKSINDNGATYAFGYDVAKRLTEITYPDGNKAQFVYDGFNRTVSQTFPGKQPLKYSYFLTKCSDGKQCDEISMSIGSETTPVAKIKNDLAGRRVSAVGYLSGSPVETQYQLDDLDNIITIQSPSSLAIQDGIDYISQTLERSLPGGDKIKIKKSTSLGQPEEVEFVGTAQNVISNIKYDGKFRPVEKVYVGTKISDVTMSYGAKGGNTDGRLEKITDNSGVTEFLYGPGGVAEGVRRTINGMEPLKTYAQKDGYGNEMTAVYPNGLVIHYIRDDKNRVTEVRKESATGAILAKVAYDVRDNLANIAYANGITTEYEYDLARRVTRIATHKADKYILDERYTYDPLGNKASVIHLDGSKVTYEYDGLNRLTKAKYFKKSSDTPFDSQEYGYDIDGNRTSYKDSIKEIQYVMESKDGKRISNRVASYTVLQKGKPTITVQFEYELGNLIKETELQNGEIVLTKSYAYDPNNRLIKATVKDNRTGFQSESEYAYDYSGRRELVSVNGAKTYYAYGESLDPLVRINTSNEIEATYIYVGGLHLATIEDETLSFFHADELGNVLKISDATGAVTQTTRYDPFGNISFMNGPSENRYLYAGKPRDEATGLIYFGARYYDPKLGRFLTRDPAGQGFNHYIYADNNPLIKRDMFGMFSFGDFFSAIADAISNVVSAYFGVDIGIPDFLGGYVDIGSPRRDEWNSNTAFSDITGGGNSTGRLSGYGCGGATGMCFSQPSQGYSDKPQASQTTKISFTNATLFGMGNNGNRSLLPNNDISGRLKSPAKNGTSNTAWKDFFNLFKTGSKTVKSDINSNQNNSGTPSLQSSAKLPEGIQPSMKVLEDANRNISYGGNANPSGNSNNFIPPQQGGVVVVNFKDNTDKGSSVVQDNQAQNNTKAGTNAAGDPVLLHSGDLLQSEVDLKIPGRGMDYEFRRTYRSRIQYDGPLGANWDHNYNKRLVVQENGDIARFDGDARFDIYKKNEDGTYTSPAGRFDVLSKLPDGTYQIRDRHGVFNRYSSAGFITSITDSNNNAITFEYADVAGASRLTKVTDTLGRAIQYQYTTSGPATGRLQKITDFSGRSVQFAIDGNGDLVAVTSPATSDFPSGKTVNYAYSQGFPEDKADLNHNLLQVTDAKGQVVLQNTYSIFDRVMTQRLGPVGQFQFEYHPLSVVADCSTSEAVVQVAYRTTVTDRSQNQSIYDFNCQGNPLLIQKLTRGVRPGDPAAYLTQYTYTIDGLPKTVTYPDGNQMQLVYANVGDVPKAVAEWSSGNLMIVRRVPDAKRGGGAPIETNYQYELLYNKPVAVTDPIGNTTRIWYDYQEGLSITAIAPLLGIDAASASKLYSPGLLGIGDVNADGVTTQAGGNVVGIDLPKAKDPDGVVQQLAMRFRYNTAGQVTRMVDAAGAITDYAYQNGYLSQVTQDVGGLGITRSMTRDTVGNVTSASDGNGKVTQFEVNPLNQIVKMTNPLGHFTQYNYDANNNLVQIDRQNLDETGAIANGNSLVTTKIEYNVLNRPTLQRSEVGEGKFVVTEFQYDANENLTRVVQPEGNSTFIQYDERDLPYKVVNGYGSSDVSMTAYRYNGAGKPTQIQDPLSHITTITYDGFNRPILTTDALGNTQTMQYDPADQMTQIQRRGPPTVGGDVNTILWARKTVYDELGRAIGITEGDRSSKLYYNFQNQLAKLVDPQGRISNFVYDPVGRLLQQILPNGDKTVVTYDGEGRVLTQTQHETHATLGLKTFATQFGYDAAGRVTQRTTADNAIWKYQYDSLGRLRVTVDPSDITHSNNFDDLGRLVSSCVDNTTTSYIWDDDSRLTAVTDAKGNKTSYTYDAQNRRTQVQFADGSIQSVIYSAVSQPTQINLPNGFAINMAYDAGNQLVSRIIAQDKANTGKEVFAYDGLGRLISGKVLDTNGATQNDLALQFDDQGLLLQATQNAKTIQSTFTAGGDRQTLAYPGNIDLSLTRDSLGRITKLADDSLGQLQATTYAGGLRPYQMTLPNGVAATLGYDAGARIKDLNWAKGATSLAQHTYSYNALSNITLDNTPSNVGDLYQYDAQGRLTQASLKVPNAPNFMGKTPTQFGAQYSYTYDAVSNWTQQTAKPANTTSAYTANALNQYTKAGTADLKYDKNGNLIQDETYSYTYNWRNLITEVRTADKALVATYKYDALGRRVAKVDGLSSDITQYIYDGWNIVEERSGTNGDTLEASYIYDERNLPVAMQRSGKLYFYQYNHLGSIESVTNKDGDVLERYQYDPFGGVKVLDGAGNALPNSQIDNPFMFAGQWRDDETGLYYMRHRYYSTSLGRFTSRDPLEYADSLNTYAYAMSNPVNFSDPLGLSTSAGALNAGAGNPTGFGFNTNSPALYLLGQASADTLKFGGGVVVGGAQGLLNMAEGLVHLATTPLWDTFRSIAGAVYHYDQTWAGIRSWGSQVANVLAKGSSYEQGKVLGNIGANVFGGEALVGAIGKAGKGAGALDDILTQLSHADFATTNNGAVFWTGYQQGNKAAAMKWAAENGKFTIEMTPGGKWLEGLDLYGAKSPVSIEQADFIWSAASEHFTWGASGHVNAFTHGTGFSQSATFYGKELPILRINPKVDPKITYRGY